MPTIIVEDGSIVSGANSYGTVTGANTYFANLNETKWTDSKVTTTAKETALLRAMGYLEALNWKGTTVSGVDQPLQWPRQDVYDRDNNELDTDYIPTNLAKAQYEAALVVLNTDDRKELEPELYRDNKVISNSIAGSIRTVYKRTAPGGTIHYIINNLLKGLIHGKSATVVRA